MEIQPPPPTDWLVAFVTPFKTRFTMLLLKVFLKSDTDNVSEELIAPPQAEQVIAVKAALGHVAVLLSKALDVTSRVLDNTPTAPPLWAELL